MQTRKWQDKNTGQDRYTTEIIADSLQMLDSKNNSGISDQTPFEKSAAASKTPEAAPALDSFDDDIPF